jgi:hypothetical protein
MEYPLEALKAKAMVHSSVDTLQFSPQQRENSMELPTVIPQGAM